MKINQKVKSAIGWIVYLAILVALVYGIPKVLVRVLDTDYPMASITSDSMWPALKEGDFVLIKGIDGKGEIAMGDIIVYKNPKGFTIHRVIKINEGTVVTKGDANNVEDKPVGYEEVVGKVVTIGEKPFRIPFLGKIGLLINKVNI